MRGPACDTLQLRERHASSNPVGIDQCRLFGLMALRSIWRVAAGVDHGQEQRTGDGGHFVGPGAGKRDVMDRNGLAQIGEGVERGEFGLK